MGISFRGLFNFFAHHFLGLSRLASAQGTDRYNNTRSTAAHFANLTCSQTEVPPRAVPWVRRSVRLELLLAAPREEDLVVPGLPVVGACHGLEDVRVWRLGGAHERLEGLWQAPGGSGSEVRRVAVEGARGFNVRQGVVEGPRGVLVQRV